MGETSHNLIGVGKVGEKTAVKWITAYGSLDGVLEHADEITGVVGEKLREQKDRAIRNRKLNHLVTDVDLPFGPADLLRKPIDPVAVREVFDRLQFKTLLERVLKIAAAEQGADFVADAAPVVSGVPVIRKLVDEELGKWLSDQSRNGQNALGLGISSAHGQVTGFGRAHHCRHLGNNPPRPGQCRKQAASTTKVRWATALLHADILPTKRPAGHQNGAGRESVQVSPQRRQAARRRTVIAGC